MRITVENYAAIRQQAEQLLTAGNYANEKEIQVFGETLDEYWHWGLISKSDAIERMVWEWVAAHPHLDLDRTINSSICQTV